MSIYVKIVADEELFIPKLSHATDAGFDLRAGYDFMIFAGQTKLIDCGFSIELPEGYKAYILPRSGLALNQGITVLNAPGLIDSGYRGRVKVILHKVCPTPPTPQFKMSIEDDVPVKFEKGARIAQMVIEPCYASLVSFKPVLSLDPSDRGENGFGSTLM